MALQSQRNSPAEIFIHLGAHTGKEQVKHKEEDFILRRHSFF